MALVAGTQMGRYEIVSPLGAGGKGEVYRAKDVRLDRFVAIKVLPERMAGDRAALSRFEREAKAVAALSHPNILTLFDVGTEAGISFAVMELLEGQTLRTRPVFCAPGATCGSLPAMRRAMWCGTGAIRNLLLRNGLERYPLPVHWWPLDFAQKMYPEGVDVAA